MLALLSGQNNNQVRDVWEGDCHREKSYLVSGSKNSMIFLFKTLSEELGLLLSSQLLATCFLFRNFPLYVLSDRGGGGRVGDAQKGCENPRGEV